MKDSELPRPAMKVMVFAYQSIGHKALSYLLEQRKPILAVVTHKDNPAEKIWFPSVAELARQHKLPLHYAEDLDSDGLYHLVQRLKPDMILSFYYRKMLAMNLLRLAPRGGLNLHGSLLPKYRGRAPANWVLVNDEKTTGVTLHEMVEKPDAGAIVAQKEIALAPRETIKTLYEKMVQKTGELMQEWYPRIERGDYPRRPQDGSQATYFGGRKPEDGQIDWNWQSRKVDCLVRAVTDPYPGAFTILDGKKLIVWEGEPMRGVQPPCRGNGSAPGQFWLNGANPCVATADGAYQITRYTLEGGGNLLSYLKKGGVKCAC